MPRKLGKSDLALTPKDVQNASTTIEGWDPTDYSVDMVGRLILLLSADDGSDGFFEAFDTLWRTADVGEQVAFYRGLLYGQPERFLWRATDGCRTNIREYSRPSPIGTPTPLNISMRSRSTSCA